MSGGEARMVARQLGRWHHEQVMDLDEISLHVYDRGFDGERHRLGGIFGKQVGPKLPVAPDATSARVTVPPGGNGYLHPVLWKSGEPVVWFEPRLVGEGSNLGVSPLPLVVTLSDA